MLKTLIRIAIFALFLATWELYLKEPFNAYLAGHNVVGFPAVYLGYFIMLLLSWIISVIVTRNIGRDKM